MSPKEKEATAVVQTGHFLTAISFHPVVRGWRLWSSVRLVSLTVTRFGHKVPTQMRICMALTLASSVVTGGKGRGDSRFLRPMAVRLPVPTHGKANPSSCSSDRGALAPSLLWALTR